MMIEWNWVWLTLSWGCYLLMSLISDSLRFASFGLIKAELQKRHSSLERIDQALHRVSGYFDDSGKNLRELEWGGQTFFLLGLYFLWGVQENESTAESILAGAIYSAMMFFMGAVGVRGFSEPFAEQILIKVYPFWKTWHVVITPLTMLVNGFQLLILRVAGVKEEEAEEEREQKILDSMEDGSKAGILDESEREMIENLIEFKDLDVGEVMTPRTEMAAVVVTANLDEVVEQMVESNFSRIMVYEENRDNVIGFVHVRDCLPFWKKDKAPLLKELLHDIYYVPDTKSIRSLFQEFKTQHLHIAIVLDEYGGTAGLITLEDILEEIVGDIVDEHQSEDEEICKMISENEVQVQGRMRVSELEEVFSMEFEENDSYDSVGGMVISHLGRIPAQGESGELNNHGLSYKVLDANNRRIEKIQFTKIIAAIES